MRKNYGRTAQMANWRRSCQQTGAMQKSETMSRILLSLSACLLAVTIRAQAPPPPAVEARLDALGKKLDEQNTKIDLLSQQILKLQQQLGGGDSRPGVMIGEGAPSPARSTSTTSTSTSPSTSTAAPAASVPPGNSHIVARGETLTSIAKTYNVSITDLQKYNHIENPLKLQAGQTLVIPPSPSPSASSSGE
jgi:LysM repeat protein